MLLLLSFGCCAAICCQLLFKQECARLCMLILLSTLATAIPDASLAFSTAFAPSLLPVCSLLMLLLALRFDGYFC
jgi:hypothetical protein